jgi:hypothetical protein
MLVGGDPVPTVATPALVRMAEALRLMRNSGRIEDGLAQLDVAAAPPDVAPVPE